MTVYSEEVWPVPFGKGLDTYNHPGNLQDGFTPVCKNFIARGDRLETRKGFTNPGGGALALTAGNDPNRFMYTQFPILGTETFPIAVFGRSKAGAAFTGIRQFNRDDQTAATTGDGRADTFGAVSDFRGACVYLDRVYFNEGQDITRATDFNWTANSFTQVLVADIGQTYGLFNFKDRMWCWDDTKIYYTEVPASAGAYPEDWNSGNNYIVIGAGQGLGKIYQVVPVGTKLLVFTSSGLYSISVLGTPANWVVRLIDNTVQVNTYACAYEYKSLVYFVDMRGVWVTDGAEVKEISGAIKDIFYDDSPTYYPYYKLHQFEDGCLVVKSKTVISGGSQYYLSDAEIYFTPLEFIAWTEFTFESAHQPMDILAGFSRIETFEDPDPTSYIILLYGTSTIATPATSFGCRLLKYSGAQDNIGGDTDYVKATCTSKINRGQLFVLKRLKYAYINYSIVGADGATPVVRYKWDTEEIAGSFVAIGGTIKDSDDSIVKIAAGLYCQHYQVTLEATCTAAISGYTIMGLGVIGHTQRNEVREQS